MPFPVDVHRQGLEHHIFKFDRVGGRDVPAGVHGIGLDGVGAGCQRQVGRPVRPVVVVVAAVQPEPFNE